MVNKLRKMAGKSRKRTVGKKQERFKPGHLLLVCLRDDTQAGLPP